MKPKRQQNRKGTAAFAVLLCQFIGMVSKTAPISPFRQMACPAISRGAQASPKFTQA